MIKLMPLVEQIQQEQLDEAGVKDIALGAAMAASSIFGGAKAQSKIPTDKPAITTIAKTPASINPNFWVSDTNDIKKVQTLFKAYRYWTLAQWKRDRALISDTTTYYSKLTPGERETIEASYMRNAPETEEDGKNGKFTSTFKFPIAFLRDLSAGTMKNLGLEGNKALEIVNKVGLSIGQMRQWNLFVDWMISKGYSNNSEMNHEDYRENVLNQYKGI